jgi:3-methyladenine DNA glycosylase/8-oxoguanine DNA glycosylase
MQFILHPSGEGFLWVSKIGYNNRMALLTLSARQPFNFRNTVRSHGWYQLAPWEYDEEAGTLNYVIRLKTGKVLEIQICEAPDGVSVELRGKLTKAETAELTEAVTWMFGLDMDFSTFYAAFLDEPKLAHAKKQARGRVLRSPTFFEDVVKTILTTNTLWAATKRMNLSLIQQYGSSLNEGKGKRAFPTPASIAASSPEVLKEAVRVGYRAPSIHELALRVDSGELDIESFKTNDLPTLELRKELLKIKGVGPYAAANLLMLLGRSDFIPIDSWALKMVSHEWYDGEPVTPAQVEEHFEKWGQFKGLAYWFWDWKYKG